VDKWTNARPACRADGQRQTESRSRENTASRWSPASLPTRQSGNRIRVHSRRWGGYPSRTFPLSDHCGGCAHAFHDAFSSCIRQALQMEVTTYRFTQGKTRDGRSGTEPKEKHRTRPAVEGCWAKPCTSDDRFRRLHLEMYSAGHQPGLRKSVHVSRRFRLPK